MENENHSQEDRVTVYPSPGAKLAEALSKAQGEIEAAEKSSENPAFKKDGKNSKYADIAEVIEVIQKVGKANGLSVIFDFKPDSANNMFIRYIIIHASGEFYEGSWVPMFLRDKTQHAFGAANTYMRRQLLKAIYQIPEDDDDGNKNSGKGANENSSQQDPQTSPQQEKKKVPNMAPQGKPKQDPHPPDEPPVTAREMLLNDLFATVDLKKIPTADVKKIILLVSGDPKVNSEMLSEDQLRSVLRMLNLQFK